jgi:general secretion pathway protein G
MAVERKKLSKRERNKKVKAIYREMEAKKRELGLSAPVIHRGPVFYMVVVLVMALLGGAIIQASGRGGGRGKMMDAKTGQAIRSVDALAEALGRYKFHCGQYPTIEEGLEALALKNSKYRGWMGPYIPKMLPDPWKRPYIYELPSTTNDVPTVLSLGPDGKRGTQDDIAPDKALFTKPFKDTTWTNDWVPFYKRGYIIVPSRDKAK